MTFQTLRNPKLSRSNKSAWYRYYAGYSSEFVEDAIDSLGKVSPTRLVDPWNGSGTTVAVARHKGLSSVGYDVNPVLVLIARSRLVTAESFSSVAPLAADVVRHADSEPLDTAPTDALRTWFAPEAADTLRALESAIRLVLVGENMDLGATVTRASPLASLFYTALFRVARDAVAGLVGTNPTWISPPPAGSEIDIPASRLKAAFTSRCEELAPRLATSRGDTPRSEVKLGNSTSMTEPDGYFGGAITSPPYLTRIDYAVATRVELATLGVSSEQFRTLRDSMIGTPTIHVGPSHPSPDWGATAQAIIDAVSSHPSRASQTYYRAYFLQYMDSMHASLGELRRVLSPQGAAIIVVQDSHYKEVHIDLASVIIDMAGMVGFGKALRVDFPLSSTKAAINRGTRKWRATFGASESVITLLGKE